ncbi:MAG: ATP-dependent helicase [Longimonas sp.]|uniref:ATP-dependent helicase n=1 Tax=Longimonas sp. TaxID=2039626 RepID=UPI00334B4262
MARRIVLQSDRSDTPAPDQLTVDYRAELNDQQYAAATADPGALLIIAGAGTGKTRTLVYRLSYLVETGLDPRSIVLLTFTRRAARDMMARAASLLDGRCQRVQGGTFHSFCVQLLRRHAPAINLAKTFTILDASDAADVLSMLRTRGGYTERDDRFPSKRALQSMFSATVNRDRSLASVLEAKYPQFTHLHDDLRKLQETYRTYKAEHHMLDFDDLLRRTHEMLAMHDDLRQQVASRCRHVLVDEYQDTNALQAKLVRQFTSVHGNVTAVGDDAQSIYRFRGADFRNIFRFPKLYEEARVLKLEQNYRSTQPILEFANHLIESADRSYDKTLFSDKTEGELPAVVPAADTSMEAQFVGQMIAQLREQGVPLSDQAVLFRSSHNAYDVEIELNRRNIPYVKYGGTKLNEAAHIKDVLAHLRVAENPDDAAAWNRILKLIHGIGPKTAQSLIDWLTEGDREPFVVDEQGPFAQRYLDTLTRLLNTLRSIRPDEAPLSEQVDAVLTYYTPLFEDAYPDDYPKRASDLEQLGHLAAGYESRQRFLADLTLDPIELSALDQEGTDDDEPPLVLSTIHSAKGLEFHTVFLIHAVDGTLPSQYALNEPGGLDEELRLLYVAVTRAEENLFISYPMLQTQRFYGDTMASPSRFIEDVPPSVLEPVELVEGPSQKQLTESEDAGPASLPEADSSREAPPTDAERSDAEHSDAERSDSSPSSTKDGLPF